MNGADEAGVQPNLIGKVLYEKGLRQGSLFRLAGVKFAFNDLPEAGSTVPKLFSRELKHDEKLVVVSQDCDIVVSGSTEPNIEALICKPEKNAKLLADADRNSIRWFLVDPETKLVAWATHRVVIAKRLLAGIEPEQWPRNPAKLSQFVQWLGRRYVRPAVRTDIVNAFQKPAIDALVNLKSTQPELYNAFNWAVPEIRLKPPSSHDPPFDIRLIMLLSPDGVDSEQVNAIDAVEEIIRDALDPNQAVLEKPWVVAYDDISARDYRDAIEIYLHHFSLDGVEILGAYPPTT